MLRYNIGQFNRVIRRVTRLELFDPKKDRMENQFSIFQCVLHIADDGSGTFVGEVQIRKKNRANVSGSC